MFRLDIIRFRRDYVSTVLWNGRMDFEDCFVSSFLCRCQRLELRGCGMEHVRCRRGWLDVFWESED